MKITWLGHSSFKLVESTGTSIVTDPFDEGVVGFPMPKVMANAVTVSHKHGDHNAIKSVLGSPQIIDELGAFEVDGIHIQSMHSYHDNVKGAKRGENLIFKFRMDGVELCHLGDIGEECNVTIVEAIMPVDILFVPIGGNYTIDAVQAKEYVDKIMPDIVIPMHYRTRDCELDIDKLNEFIDLFDEEDVIYADSDTLEYDRADFDGETTKVVVLDKVQLN